MHTHTHTRLPTTQKRAVQALRRAQSPTLYVGKLAAVVSATGALTRQLPESLLVGYRADSLSHTHLPKFSADRRVLALSIEKVKTEDRLVSACYYDCLLYRRPVRTNPALAFSCKRTETCIGGALTQPKTMEELSPVPPMRFLHHKTHPDAASWAFSEPQNRVEQVISNHGDTRTWIAMVTPWSSLQLGRYVSSEGRIRAR